MFFCSQLKQLESLQALVRQFNVTIFEALSDYQSDEKNSSIKIAAIFSQLFCGRNSTFIGEEETSLEKTMKKQTDYFDDDAEKEEEPVYIYQNDTSESYTDQNMAAFVSNN